MTIIRKLFLPPELVSTVNKHAKQINITFSLTKRNLLSLQKYAENYPEGMEAFENIINEAACIAVRALTKGKLKSPISTNLYKEVEIEDRVFMGFGFTLKARNHLTVTNITIYNEAEYDFCC